MLKSAVIAAAICLVCNCNLLADFAPVPQNTNGYYEVHYAHKAAPIDNPMKGFVPYLHDPGRRLFPHSMSFEYLPLNSLMTGPTNFNWQALETDLEASEKEGNQFGFRVYLDFPAMQTGIPGFLLKQGLQTHIYGSYHNKTSLIPDYEDIRLRNAITNFIAALGNRYDGDPRIGYIEAGLLGFWGEWHCYPVAKSLPSIVQKEVLDAYQAAFKKTKILVRLPEIENKDRPFGYHDDSFCWDTLGKGEHSMLGRMKVVGEAAMKKWKSQPFEGELRPELWGIPYNAELIRAGGQDFDQCVEQTHASWIRDSGAFAASNTGMKRVLALEKARRLGYELFVSTLKGQRKSDDLLVSLSFQNLGVAPFCYRWPVEIAVAGDDGQIIKRWPATWDITQIMPGESPTIFAATLNALPSGGRYLLLRVANPMPGGKDIRFANTTQDLTVSGWLTLLDFGARSDTNQAVDKEKLASTPDHAGGI
jgi:hypothetical protein